jgi:hypothetical protein
LGRRFVWSDPEVQRLAASFVCVADEVGRLQRGKDAECRLFQKVAEQGHYAGRTKPTNTRQGIYATTADGTLLASVNTTRARDMVAMLEKALSAWAARGAATEVEASTADRLTAKRWESRYPEDGLVLCATARDLPRDEETKRGWRTQAWNVDFAWFDRMDVRRMVPKSVDVGTRHTIPEPLVSRLLRCHMVDNVRGQTTAFPRDSVEKALLDAEVTGTEGTLLSLRLTGTVRAVRRGRWPVDGYKDAAAPTDQELGLDATLLGYATFDRATGRFTRFDLVALGTRWGGTQYNARHDDLDPSAIGFGFALADDRPSYRVAPALIWDYGWRSP